jgi:sulfur carrier protein ThiS
MKVQVEVLGLPSLARLIGKKGELEFSGSTVADIVRHIVKRHGQNARKVMLDDDGRLDHVIQIMINNEGIMPRDDYGRRELKEGDDVKFMLLVGGG